METYNRNQPIILKLDASSSDRIITVFQCKSGAEDAGYLKNADHVVLNGFVKTLRIKSAIKSVPEVQLPNLSVEQSRTERLNLLRNLEWTSPRKELWLYVAETFNNWLPIASVSLLNIQPYRIINLMEYLTENLAFELGSTGAIGVAIKNAGYGLLGANDEVIVYGSATTEVVVIPASIPNLEKCDSYGWEIGTNSGLILPAQQNAKQLTFTNTGAGKIFLSVGKNAELNKGIALMPNGGSYEFNRSNNPFTLPIYAIASEASTLSGLVCV